MQTFLPYINFEETFRCLDYRRLGKQRVEAKQILDILTTDVKSNWRNHPAVKMWRGYEVALERYKNLAIAEWVRRGYKNTMELTCNCIGLFKLPDWLNDEFCASHRSNLLRKNFDYYNRFNWSVPGNLKYVWPVK